MCNLSQGIREKGGAEREEKIILNMHREGYKGRKKVVTDCLFFMQRKDFCTNDSNSSAIPIHKLSDCTI